MRGFLIIKGLSIVETYGKEIDKSRIEIIEKFLVRV